MGNPAIHVRRLMTAEGMAPAGHILPDHVSIELAFMAYLASCEASFWELADGERASRYLHRQESFLQEHLMQWLPQFCNRILTGRPHARYSALARQAHSFVAADLVQVQAWSGRSSDEGHIEVDSRDWWRVWVGPDCTLCDICVQVCRPGALRLGLQEQETVLSYEAALCDGCAACQRWCPEETIHVERVEECPAESELVRSAQLACPGCGRLHAPASMVDKVRGRLGEVSESMLQCLIMCPDCKAKAMRLSFERRRPRQTE